MQQYHDVIQVSVYRLIHAFFWIREDWVLSFEIPAMAVCCGWCQKLHRALPLVGCPVPVTYVQHVCSTGRTDPGLMHWPASSTHGMTCTSACQLERPWFGWMIVSCHGRRKLIVSSWFQLISQQRTRVQVGRFYLLLLSWNLCIFGLTT